ncbi:transcriptional regulator, LysR family [Hyphomonas neptunium ATCC 15444]|uniref:Transcriptional regulator, LysR family n=2 Tax=Hyphomonas TaxID=85 RepID=Q0C261_HYPNA|nr:MULTISPECIES: LysR family transcriptional regulator [Hyphomonas]ABI77700.1 transcriptional regulator, LysR family [Hyphomonas neptunium ATCC 15444]
MNVDWLEDYLALIEAGGFARAAERRAMTQPTFSRRIRALEDWVGVTLIDRGTHTMRLTPAGERFKTVAELATRQLQLGREEARAVAKASSETLRFAATHALSLTFFPNWLRQLEKDEPATVTVELTADHMVACERLMIEGRAQFLLCHHHEAAPTRLGRDFRSVLLGGDVLLPVISPQLAAETPPEKAPQLALSPESGMGRILAAAWAMTGREPPSMPAFTSHLASVLTAMARNGRGVAWTALSLVSEDISTGKLMRAGTPEQDVPIEIRLWRPATRQSPAAEALWSKILKSQKSALSAGQTTNDP